MPRTIAIGDIHGCSLALDALLEAIRPAEGDCLVALGDYVDRGPDSRGVLERMLALEADGLLVPLLGNHEEMMLGAIRGSSPIGSWLRHGGIATLRSYGPRADLRDVPTEHQEFMLRCVPHFETDGALFFHANYVADEPLERQPAEALRWQNLAEHLPGPHVSGKRAFVGHSSQKSGEVLDHGYLVCLDTYCHGGGWLTAMDTESGQLWQAAADGRLRH
ncbi:metallophosphoesterase family protein [Botrimarina sp.]|uniref:metallophosphoesterase family protein n=1 Tax=Botrimarina sp. TaxID=2795802 RepID=UPI0032EB0AFF